MKKGADFCLPCLDRLQSRSRLAEDLEQNDTGPASEEGIRSGTAARDDRLRRTEHDGSGNGRPDPRVANRSGTFFTTMLLAVSACEPPRNSEAINVRYRCFIGSCAGAAGMDDGGTALPLLSATIKGQGALANRRSGARFRITLHRALKRRAERSRRPQCRKQHGNGRSRPVVRML